MPITTILQKKAPAMGGGDYDSWSRRFSCYFTAERSTVNWPYHAERRGPKPPEISPEFKPLKFASIDAQQDTKGETNDTYDRKRL
jgi:hypothetical protein